MGRNKFSLVVYAIIGLAGIGLLSQLFTNTANFIKSILVMIGIALVLYGIVYYFFIRSRTKSDEMAKYKQAVKQSKLKYKQSQKPNHVPKKSIKSNTKIKRRRTRRAPHLRVIEGNKSKKDDRANF